MSCRPVKCSQCPNTTKECLIKEGLCPMCYANKMRREQEAKNQNKDKQ